MPRIYDPNSERLIPLATSVTLRALCVSGSLLVLNRRLLEVVSSIGRSVLLLIELSFGGCVAIDGLVLLCGLAGCVSVSVRSVLFGFLCLEAVDLLLCLGNVL
jgi:hypothetical protein